MKYLSSFTFIDFVHGFTFYRVESRKIDLISLSLVDPVLEYYVVFHDFDFCGVFCSFDDAKKSVCLI